MPITNPKNRLYSALPMQPLLASLFGQGQLVKVQKIKGRTRIRTGVVRIKTESDNHYTIQPTSEILENAASTPRFFLITWLILNMTNFPSNISIIIKIYSLSTILWLFE